MSGTSINDSMDQVVVYLRISEDRTGAEAGVERQRQNCLVAYDAYSPATSQPFQLRVNGTLLVAVGALAAVAGWCSSALRCSRRG
ncbi:hypothetical protein GCM10009786_19050 [Leucobacter alluvii]|uniref:Resolvase/invertase-type recombinase catalytic domain-containing protein n=1 Tax=Leucobacter alluvii TaxID=340321 RepID=A0ABP5N1L2_9MICO